MMNRQFGGAPSGHPIMTSDDFIGYSDVDDASVYKYDFQTLDAISRHHAHLATLDSVPQRRVFIDMAQACSWISDGEIASFLSFLVSATQPTHIVMFHSYPYSDHAHTPRLEAIFRELTPELLAPVRMLTFFHYKLSREDMYYLKQDTLTHCLFQQDIALCLTWAFYYGYEEQMRYLDTIEWFEGYRHEFHMDDGDQYCSDPIINGKNLEFYYDYYEQRASRLL
eukprot:gnl/Dysnectes_brevis/1114_a1245_1553.p1 GENE.gnl/Dysnectes_brevis/1114_a1245_1553~~gnl/Dysnectes_brevis/1114_a1245_1553.p1  ORF type:complete len:224 (-),score=72.80 gnl/Dysnectes_brevis/1114_a1245_1553:51-722(-)